MVQKSSKSESQFGQKIAELRKARKLSMQKLAKATGISAAYICRLESGERHPSRDLLNNLIDVLLPKGSSQEKDELLILAGFAPSNFRNFMGRQDVMAIFEGLLAENPNDFKAYIALVLNLIRAGRHQEALKRISHGMTQFDDMVQLQALMAALELSKGHFEQAIVFQTEALHYLDMPSEFSNPPSNLNRGDLLLGLGVMRLMKGNHLIYAAADLRGEDSEDQAKSQEKKALKVLMEAKQTFTEALQEFPEDVYVLDELARTTINLAYLYQGKKAETYWREAVTVFEQVVCSGSKQEIGYENLIESISYLAYSYLKCHEFERAWLNINLVEACLPNYWVIHYIKADYYCLLFASKYAKKKKQEGLDLLHLGLQALEKAISIEDEDNRALEQAKVDPDLQFIRQYYRAEFESLVNVGPNK